MYLKTSRLLSLLLLLNLCMAACAYGQLRQVSGELVEFIRISQDQHDRPASLQVALVSYQKGDVTVDLVSAVHVAEKEYYDDLNRRFSHYDAVLYELVAPEGTKIPKGGIEKGGVVAALQRGMKNALGLSFQLEELDYTPNHFLHADMSPQEFAESMRNKGESILGMFLKLWITALAQQQTGTAVTSDLDILRALFSNDKQNAFRTMVARELASSQGMITAISGPEGSTLVTERNKKALEVLKTAMLDGHKRIAIFYGAAHMDDMAERLLRDFGFQFRTIEWLDAWELD